MCKSKTTKRDVTYWICVSEDSNRVPTEFTCLRPCYSSLKNINTLIKDDHKNAVKIVFEASTVVKKNDETLEQFILRLASDGQRVDYILYARDRKIIKVEDAFFNCLYRSEEQNL